MKFIKLKSLLIVLVILVVLLEGVQVYFSFFIYKKYQNNILNEVPPLHRSGR